jgi:sorting nexin-4
MSSKDHDAATIVAGQSNEAPQKLSPLRARASNSASAHDVAPDPSSTEEQLAAYDSLIDISASAHNIDSLDSHEGTSNDFDDFDDDRFSVVTVSAAGSLHLSENNEYDQDHDFETFEPIEIVQARLATESASQLIPRLSAAENTNLVTDMENARDWQQAGHNADPQDLAGPGAHGQLICNVSSPQKEGEGTQNSYVSYLVTTDTDFKSFQQPHSTVRRRFTDFVFLYNTLVKEYPQCAVPPPPDKHNMSYVRGDRFAPDFTARRAHSLRRFLGRLALHPVLRRATILTLFLESSDWNATMRNRPHRGMSGSDAGNSSVLESWTDSFLNAFSKVHKTDKRFQDVNDHATKLDDDLGTVSKVVARVAKRESDLTSDYADLSTQFQKLAQLEPSVQNDLNKFSTGVQSTSEGWRTLHEHTDRDYLTSLKDMESYISAVKSLLKTREQKQLDFEGLTDYLSKAHQERDSLASAHNASGLGASGFIRAKLEDVRGVDHEQARRERVRKLEVSIARLTDEVENAKKTTEAFDEEVVKEVADFERIKAVEFRDTLGGLADAHVDFFKGNIAIWEKFVKEEEALMAAEGETSVA